MSEANLNRVRGTHRPVGPLARFLALLETTSPARGEGWSRDKTAVIIHRACFAPNQRLMLVC